MTRREEFGVCYAHAFDGSSYALARTEYDRLVGQWMQGQAFFIGVGLYGQPVSIKLARIEGVSDFSPEHIAAFDADVREEKKSEMLNGD